jgi:hypothetical protein
MSDVSDDRFADERMRELFVARYMLESESSAVADLDEVAAQIDSATLARVKAGMRAGAVVRQGVTFYAVGDAAWRSGCLAMGLGDRCYSGGMWLGDTGRGRAGALPLPAGRLERP